MCLQGSLQGNSVSYLILLVKYAFKGIGQNVINKTITRQLKNTVGFGPLGLSSNPATKGTASKTEITHSLLAQFLLL